MTLEHDVHEIIKTIIYEDNLPILKGNGGSYPVSSDVLDFRISLNESNVLPLIPGSGIRWKDLLLVKADSLGTRMLFSPKDSAYLMSLNSTWLNKRQSLKSLGAEGVRVAPLLILEEELDELSGKSAAFFIFSKPVISEDHSRAYIEVAFVCNRLCGYGHSYSLQKIAGKWRVMNEEITYFE